jgi:hypothetical protein
MSEEETNKEEEVYHDLSGEQTTKVKTKFHFKTIHFFQTNF